MPAVLEEPVGRAPELARLEALLDGLSDGGATALAVEGEAGIGKTHLLGRLRAAAELRDHLVLSGSASEFERDLSLGLWVQALDAYVTASDRDLLAALDDDARGALAGVLSSVAVTGEPPAADERHRIYRGIRELLGEIARDRCVVLILDDLHWADDASTEAITAMLRRPPEASVLLALGFRSGRAPRRLAAALHAGGVEVIGLAPLSADESALLAGPELSGAQAAAIYAESGGNPFYTLQMARATSAPVRSRTGDRVAAGTGVPRLVAASILDELRSLSEPARTLLDAAAIAGDPFDIDVAAAIACAQPDAVLAVLDELLDQRLVGVTEVPRRFAFRHPLMRRAVLESTPAGWRIGAHGRAAQALAPNRPPAVVAHHVEQSAAPGDADAIAVLLAAGRADASRNPAGAARWHTAALRLIPAHDDAARLDALVRLAEALRATGDLEGCAARLLEALDLVPAEDVGLRLRLTSAYAGCQHFLGQHPKAEAHLRRAMEGFAGPGSREEVHVLMDMTMGAFFTLDDEKMCRLARDALASAERLADRSLITATTCALAHVTGITGKAAEASAAIDRARALLEPLGDSELVPFLEPLNRLVYAELLTGRYVDVNTDGARSVAVARRSGGLAYAPLKLAALSQSLTMTGDYAGACEHLAEALEVAEVNANDYVTSSVLSTTAFALLLQGDVAGALGLAERGTAMVGELSRSRIAMMVRFALALGRRLEGAGAAATEELVSDAGGWTLAAVTPITRAAAFEMLVRTELAAGRVEEARDHAAAAQATASAFDMPMAGVFAERARARVASAGGDNAGAAEVALASAARAESLAAPVEAARSGVVAGLALLPAERARGVELLRAAEAVFDAAGAVPDRGEARRELRRLGVRVEPRRQSGDPGGGLSSLSAREREIAGLVRDRKTNREIAADLFLSEKTVESHLRNIFAKLGASSRVTVARALEAAEEG